MEKRYSTGYVYKHHGYWYAGLRCYEGRGSKLISKSMGVRCHPDILDDEGNVKKRDNRGKATAEERMRVWRDELVGADEPVVETSSSGTKLYDYCKKYLDLHPVKASTMSGYVTTTRKLAGTSLGETPLRNVTSDDIRAWEQAMRDNELSETTIAHHHAFVAQVMNHAVDKGDIRKSPIARRSAPRRKRKPVNSATGEGRRAILDKMEALGPTPFSTGVRMALLTGMRRGEICALRWQDVDLKRRVIHVVHALTKDHGYRLDTPKDPAGGDSTRDVPIGRTLAAQLAERKDEQVAELVEFDGEWDDSIYVIGEALDGTWKNPDMLGREWRALVSVEGWRGTQGEPLRFHDLRHTYATLAIKDRVMDVMALSRILGHKDASMTLNIYADALEEAKRAGVDAMDETL